MEKELQRLEEEGEKDSRSNLIWSRKRSPRRKARSQKAGRTPFRILFPIGEFHLFFHETPPRASFGSSSFSQSVSQTDEAQNPKAIASPGNTANPGEISMNVWASSSFSPAGMGRLSPQA